MMASATRMRMMWPALGSARKSPTCSPSRSSQRLGDGRRFERLILRALFDQGTFQLDQFLTVFLLNTPARFDTLVLEVSTVRVDTRRGRPGGIQRCTSGGERGFPARSCFD